MAASGLPLPPRLSAVGPLNPPSASYRAPSLAGAGPPTVPTPPKPDDSRPLSSSRSTGTSRAMISPSRPPSHSTTQPPSFVPSTSRSPHEKDQPSATQERAALTWAAYVAQARTEASLQGQGPLHSLRPATPDLAFRTPAGGTGDRTWARRTPPHSALPGSGSASASYMPDGPSSREYFSRVSSSSKPLFSGTPASALRGTAGPADDHTTLVSNSEDSGDSTVVEAARQLRFRLADLHVEVQTLNNRSNDHLKELERSEQARMYWQEEAQRLRRLLQPGALLGAGPPDGSPVRSAREAPLRSEGLYSSGI